MPLSESSAGGQTVERGWENSVVDETPSSGAGFYCHLFIELAIGRAKSPSVLPICVRQVLSGRDREIGEMVLQNRRFVFDERPE